jgi:hypothetical protein
VSGALIPWKFGSGKCSQGRMVQRYSRTNQAKASVRLLDNRASFN